VILVGLGSVAAVCGDRSPMDNQSLMPEWHRFLDYDCDNDNDNDSDNDNDFGRGSAFS